jgi:SAM-dependent MidA family methyltransferase
VLLSKTVAEPRQPHYLVTEILAILRQLIEREKVVTFARFMELALYCPQIGYYEREESRLGRGGDFYTSVNTGPLFGELLAWRFLDWLSEIGEGTVQLVEAGAHEGQLAFDILTSLQNRIPQLLQNLEYWLVEPSRRRQRWQQKRLEEFAGHVRWFESWEALPSTGVRGIIFSNELLDAFPAHVLRWEAVSNHWAEWGVGLESGQFVWRKMLHDSFEWEPKLIDAGFRLPLELKPFLANGLVIEISLAASDWWRRAAMALRAGKLLTIDYGLAAEELISPQRQQGTLRAYQRHRTHPEVLLIPGEQDLTAHVNFAQLQKAGEAEGLKTDGLFSQAQFLTQIVKNSMASFAPFSDWTSSRTRQFQTLTHPEHLGRSFRVLIQSRSIT